MKDPLGSFLYFYTWLAWFGFPLLLLVVKFTPKNDFHLGYEKGYRDCTDNLDYS